MIAIGRIKVVLGEIGRRRRDFVTYFAQEISTLIGFNSGILNSFEVILLYILN